MKMVAVLWMLIACWLFGFPLESCGQSASPKEGPIFDSVRVDGRYLSRGPLDSLLLSISREPDSIKFPHIKRIIAQNSPETNCWFLDYFLFVTDFPDWNNYDIFLMNSRIKRDFYRWIIKSKKILDDSDMNFSLKKGAKDVLNGAYYTKVVKNNRKFRRNRFALRYRGRVLRGSSIDSMHIAMSRPSDSASLACLLEVVASNDRETSNRFVLHFLSKCEYYFPTCYTIFDVRNDNTAKVFSRLYNQDYIQDDSFAKYSTCNAILEIVRGNFYKKVEKLGCKDFYFYLF